MIHLYKVKVRISKRGSYVTYLVEAKDSIEAREKLQAW